MESAPAEGNFEWCNLFLSAFSCQARRPPSPPSIHTCRLPAAPRVDTFSFCVSCTHIYRLSALRIATQLPQLLLLIPYDVDPVREQQTLKPSTGPTSVGYQQKTSFKKRGFIMPTVFLTQWKSIEGLLTLARAAAQWNRCAGFEQWSHGTASQRREIADSAGSCSTYLLTHTMTSSWLFWSHQAIAASTGTKRGRQMDIKTGQIKGKGVWEWAEGDFWAPDWESKGTGLKPRSADTPTCMSKVRCWVVGPMTRS